MPGAGPGLIVLIKGEGARVGTRRPIRGQDPGHMITLDQSDPGTGDRNCNKGDGGQSKQKREREYLGYE